jgi:hypothetical protein
MFLESKRLERQISSLKTFLTFLQDRAQGKSEGIRSLVKCIDDLPDIPRKDADHDTDLYFGGLKGAPPFARILLDERDAHRWDELLVVSPYWQDVANQTSRFRCLSYTLIPAKGYPSSEDKKQRYNLTLKQVEDIKSEVGPGSVELRDFSAPKQGAWRFRHAKAYFAVKGDRVRAGIGSCNFTDAGLSGEDGNIESMIVSDLKESYIEDLRNALKQVRLVDDDFETNPVDDLPQHLPFIISVVFDWQKHTYLYKVDVVTQDAPGEMSLHLPGIDMVISLPELNSAGELSVDRKFKRIDNYRISYILGEKHLDHIGPVIEINTDHSQKEYSRTPSVQDILLSWSSSDESLDRLPKSNDDPNGEDETPVTVLTGEIDKPDELANDILGYYDIYRAFYDLRAKLRKAREEQNARKIGLYLERRYDSLKRLFTSIQNAQDSIRKYLLLVEIGKLTGEYSRYLADQEWSVEAKQAELAARTQLLTMVAAELQKNAYPGKIDAQQLLDWFDSKFKH